MINTIHNINASANRCILRNLFVFICIPLWSLLSVSTASGQSTIWSNPINGSVNSNNALTSGQTVTSNLTVSGITRGSSSVTAATTTGAYSATNWSSNSSISTSHYFEFTLTPNPGYTINLSQLVFEGLRASGGPRKFAVRSSADNFSSNIGTLADQTNTSNFTRTVSLTGSAYQNIYSEPITFRLYGWNASGSNANSRQFQVNSFSFTGSVVAQPEAIWRNPIIGNTSNGSFNSGSIHNVNVTVGGINRGGGLSSVSGTDNYGATGWQTNSSPVNNDYFQFNITPAAGHVINFESFSFNGIRTSNGPRSFVLRTSLDNFDSNISSISNVTSTSSFDKTVDMTGVSAIGTITIRLYGYNAPNTSSSELRINDFVFYGSVTSLPAPNISSFYPTNGCSVYGETFTITGQHFNQVTDVKLNSVSVPYTVLSSTQIQVSVAEGTSTGYVSVSTISGTTTSSEQFTVYESGFNALLQANFDINSLAGWTTSTGTAFSSSDNSPITGSRSLYTSSSNWSFFSSDVASAYISRPIDNILPLNQNKTVWRFNSRMTTSVEGWFGEYNSEAYYMVAVNNTNLQAGDLNGYAIRFNHTGSTSIFGGSTNNYSVGLYRFQNGTPQLIGSSYSFNFNSTNVGVELTRTSDGEWTLKLDNNGGFDNLITRVTVTDTQYTDVNNFGVRTRLTSSGIFSGTNSNFRFDDLVITQGYCEEIYYSQSNGNAQNNVWQRERQGLTTCTVANSSRVSFVVQAGDTITMNHDWVGKNFIIESTGSLQIAENKSLTLFGDLDVQGILGTGNGTLYFSGNQAQEIHAAATLNLYDVVLDNHNTLSLPANVVTNIKAKGNIVIDSGTLHTNDNLLLRSTAAGTASIGQIADGSSVNGKVTQERFLPNMTSAALVGNGSWMAVGTPLIGATVAQWDETVVTTGFTGSNYPAPGYTFNNIQWYNESIPGGLGNGYVGVSHINEALKPNKGYFFYTYANLPSPQNMLRAKGNIQQGAFVDTVFYNASGNPDADGWNLLVNRYPSEVDFKAMAEAGTGNIRMFHLFDAETNNYKVYHTAAVGTAPQYIASGQAFFVKADAPGATLQYRETFKSRNNVAFERSATEASYAAIRFFKAANSSDECVINFNTDATGNYEYDFDAKKLPSQEVGAAECALVSEDGVRLTIDSRPLNAEGNIAIPVFVKMPNNGTYRLRIEEVNNLPLGTCLMIEDLVTGNTIPFVAGQELVISHTGNYSGNRFLIHATPSIETTASNLDCNNANNGSISLDVPQGEWNITLTDTLGQAYTAEEGSYTFNNLPAQVYTVTATPIASGCITTSKTIELSEPAAITFEALNSTPAFCNSSASGVIAWQVTNAPSYEFTVKNANNEVVNSGTSGSGVKAIQGLNADVYTVTLQTYCGSQEFVFDLHDQSVVAAEILSDDIFFALAEGTTQTLTIEQSNTNATNFQWTLSNGFVSNESEFNYEFTEAGIYTLTLVANSETCSATDSIEIVVDRAVSITELNDESNISVLQTSVSLEVYLNYQSSEKTTVTVYDMNGKVISNITTSTWKGKNISIGTGGLATGMYILKVTNNNEELLHKKFINP